jgi:arginine exporter protein ArgO
MFSAGTAAAAWLTVLQPVLEALFNALGASFAGWLASKRAEETQQDLGAAQARNEQAQATIAAQQSELQAQADAPQSVDDAIKRLEDGSA